MKSPAFGIGYSLWLRLRWVLSGILLLMLILAVTVQLFPDVAPYCCGTSIVIVFMATVFLLNSFSFGPADLGVKSSGFPTHMRTLPVSTRAMVGWPMLFAAATFAILWALPACLIFMPAGFPLPVLWPATMFAAICLWVQAVGWSPFSTPFARVPVLLIAIAPLIMPLAWGITFFDGTAVSALVVACGLSWSIAAYAFGVRGLSRARTGSEGDWFRIVVEWWSARTRHRYAVGSRRRPFRSPFTAQLWHECRRNAPVLPIMTAFVGLPMLAMLCLSIFNNRPKDNFLFGSLTISHQVMGLAIWVLIPFGFALMQGAGMAKFDFWGKEPIAAFFATRPFTTAQFVLVKLCATALSATAAWAVTFVLFAVWAIVEASPLHSGESMVRTALAQATPRTAAIFIAALLGLVAMTWRNMVSGMWPTLTGRKRLAFIIGLAFLAAYCVTGLAATWVYQHRTWHALFFSLLPWILGLLVAFKVGVAVFVSLALQNRGLISAKTMRLLAVAWLLLAGCLFGGLCLLVPPTWTLAVIVLMSLPFPSFAAAPLALHWNRHR